MSNSSPVGKASEAVVVDTSPRLPEALVMSNYRDKYKHVKGAAECREAILELHKIKVSTKSQDLLGAVDKLSTDLYSSKVHFVMELIQNADDNMYSESVTPTLKLELQEHALLVFNNEIGFNLDNIIAISAVSASTKKGLTGFIGQKGIGFKSVFSVSDSPEIHSGGFHLCYNSTINMLEPIWIDETPTDPWPMTIDYATCLRLKFNATKLKNRPLLTEQLSDVFNDKLLLFLNKLECMVWEDRNRASTVTHQKTNLSASWTTLSTTEEHKDNTTFKETFWYIRRQTIVNPQVLRNNVEIEKTVLALAFKFKKSSSLVDDEENDSCLSELEFDITDERFPIFAFLPTNTEAFKFVVQGDFLLPTNRESIMESNDWNQLLLDQIPDLFVGMLKDLFDYLEHPDISSDASPFAELKTTVYSVKMCEHKIFDLLPIRSETAKTYKGVVDDIYSRLQHMRLFRSQSDCLCAPSELFSVDHLPFDFSRVVSEELLFATFGRRLLKSNNYFEFNDELLSLLHIPKFDVNCVIKLLGQLSYTLSSSVESWDSKLKLIGSLLLCVQLMLPAAPTAHPTSKAPVKSSMVPVQVVLKGATTAPPTTKMAAQKDIADVVSRLKALPIWPTLAREFVTLADGRVLFTKLNSEVDKKAENLCLSYFQDELLFLDDQLLSCICDDKSLNEVFRPSDLKGFQSFVFTRFCCDDDVSSLQGSRVGGVLGASGGIQRLTSSIVLSSVIMPTYTRLVSHADENGIVPDMSREKAAALLAFAFLCSKGARKRPSNENKFAVVTPVLQAHDVKEVRWRVPEVRVLNRNNSGMLGYSI
jgi:hypothetical protein